MVMPYKEEETQAWVDSLGLPNKLEQEDWYEWSGRLAEERRGREIYGTQIEELSHHDFEKMKERLLGSTVLKPITLKKVKDASMMKIDRMIMDLKGVSDGN